MRTRLMLLLIAFLMLMPLLFGISFSQSITMNNGLQVFTEDDIVCAWNASADITAQNITFFRDGTVFWNDYESSGPFSVTATIDSTSTQKNQAWRCNVTLFNGTNQTSQEENITIQNSAPETPIIYAPGDIDIDTVWNVSEDSTLVLNMTASDPDNDTLYYYFKAPTQEFCTMTDTALGIATCTPTQDDLVSNNDTPVNITFWVDDDDPFKAKSSSLKVTFTVMPVNDPPTTTTLANKSTLVNETLTHDFSATDEENDFPISFSLFDVPAEISGKLSITNLTANTARLTYDATSVDYNDVNASGWVAGINITDAVGNTTLYYWKLTINPIGRPPYYLNITPAGPYSILQGGSIQINFSANDYDDNEILTFSDDTDFFNIATTQQYTNISNATATIDFTPTDAAVGIFNVTITLTDKFSVTNSTILEFTVNNTNDAPIIYNESYAPSNTLGNDDLYNVTGYSSLLLTFTVNGTDPDIDSGDNITFSDNTTLFAIDSSTGVISFTPSATNISATPYHINITVTDNVSVSTSALMRLWILNNTLPYFNPAVPNVTCTEGANCIFNFSDYATDDDSGDYIVSYVPTFLGQELATFSMNQTSGLVGFIPAQTELGNYSLSIVITDTKGATATTNWTLEINDTPDTPVLTRWDFSSATIVQDHLFTYQHQATDDDLLIINGTENITFTDNLTGSNITFQSIQSSTVYALFTWLPNANDTGSHTIQINATDTTGLFDTVNFSFTVLPDSDPPNLTRIRPYGNASDGDQILQDFILTTDAQFAGDNVAPVALTENITVIFDFNATDDLTSTAQLLRAWYYDGAYVSGAKPYSREFNFSSEGAHTLMLVVNDTYLETVNWTWNLTVADLNRQPLLVTNLTTPVVINATTVFNDYLYRQNSNTKFIDPDNDLNSNNLIDGAETNTLTFAATTCDVASISFSGPTVTITPSAEGTCNVTFTATDPSSSSLQSNTVLINITDLAEGEVETETVSNPSGGGGSSSSRSSFIPITKEVQKPEAINILAPQIVTVYENTSVIIPFQVKNTWTEPLEFIHLGAISNSTRIIPLLSSDIIESLLPNETVDLELKIKNYRLGDNYEVELIANVTTPDFSDSALVLLTSIEQASDGDETEIKVTFARDLFNEHPECQELNELLDKANEELKVSNFAEARRYVDTAINGCKYLVSTLQQRTDRPDQLPSTIILSELTFKTLLYLALALVGLITIIFIIYYHYSNKEEDEI